MVSVKSYESIFDLDQKSVELFGFGKKKNQSNEIDDDRSSESLLAILGGSILLLIAYCYILVKYHDSMHSSFEDTKKKYRG